MQKFTRAFTDFAEEDLSEAARVRTAMGYALLKYSPAGYPLTCVFTVIWSVNYSDETLREAPMQRLLLVEDSEKDLQQAANSAYSMGIEQVDARTSLRGARA